MPVFHLSNLEDQRLDPFRNLKATNETRWSGGFVVEGQKLTERLLESDFEVRALLVGQSYLDAYQPQVASYDVLVVPDAWIERIVGFNFHRGVLASARRKPSADLAAICRRPRVTLAVCPDVQDPENVGSLLRIASALGIDAVVLGPHCCDPFSRRVLRVSMGAALRVPICQVEPLADVMQSLRSEHGVEFWATVTDASATAFDKAQRPARLALLLGSEGHGLSPQWLERCDRRVTIPMQPGVDSLNVAVAAGIMLYHFTRSS